MADNTILPGTGETYAADDIEGVKFQRVKPTTGSGGDARDVSHVDPMPVSEASMIEVLTELREIRRLLIMMNN